MSRMLDLEGGAFSTRNQMPAARSGLVYVLLLGVLAAVYWPTLSYGPVVDDPDQIHWVSRFDSFSEVVGTDASGLFRPVKNIAFYFFARDGGLFDLRVASLLLFAAFGTVYHRFASRFLKAQWALFSAFLLVLHPAQVASVAFPSAINNIFSAIFILLFAHIAAGYLERAQGGRTAWPLLLIFGALALFGYELGVVIVPLSVLLAFYFRKSAGPSRSASLVALSLVLVGAYLLIRGNDHAIAEMSHPMIPPSTSNLELFFSAPYYTLKHLSMAVFPLGQGGVLLADDPRGALPTELPFWALLGALLVAALWGVERRRSRLALGLLFFIFAMTPLSNWIPLRNGPIANYYLLLPLCGLALAAGTLFESWFARTQSRFCLLAGVVVLALLAGGAAYRASWWDSQYSIYEFTARNHPDNWVAWNNRGVALVAQGERDTALEAFERSTSLADWYVAPYENQLWLLLLSERNAEAVELVEARGSRFSPGLAAAAAIAYTREGDAQGAREWARHAKPGQLRPAQVKWFEGAMKRLGDE